MNIRTARISTAAATVLSAMVASAALAGTAGATALDGPPVVISAGDSAPWVSCYYGGNGDGAETCHFGDKDRIKRVEWHSMKNDWAATYFNGTKTEVSFKTGLVGATDHVIYAIITDAKGNKRAAYTHAEG